MTARISRSSLTYTFRVSSGRKFVRLHLYPATYNGLDVSNVTFYVTCGAYTFLRNFSAAAVNLDYVVKEFSVNVNPSDEALKVTFTPSPNAYAFVNGIEVVSHPNDLYSGRGDIRVIGQSSLFDMDNSTAFENLYRLNVGGNDISPSGDTGMFRRWQDDFSYIFSAATGITEVTDADVGIRFPSGSPSYVAPLDLYSTLRSMGPNPFVNLNYNLTWVFDIHPGFSYLIRLHFCETTNVVTKVNQRVFSIFLNNQTAEEQADVIGWVGSNGVPFHRDFIVFVPDEPSRRQLWLDLHPSTASKPQFYDAILNGVEIFKINDSNGNLAAPTPNPLPQSSIDSLAKNFPRSGKNHKFIIIGGVVGGMFVMITLVGLFLFFAARMHKQKTVRSTGDPDSVVPARQQACLAASQ